MKKKVLAAILAATMVVGLTACGGSKDTASTTDSSAASSAEASGSDTFKIGATGPITGGAAIYGNAVKNGIQIAVDEINEAGGINGYQIDYNFQDDEHDAEKAVACRFSSEPPPVLRVSQLLRRLMQTTCSRLHRPEQQ